MHTVYLDQVRLRQKYCGPQVLPDCGSNSWPSDHDSTFHVTEMPALATWQSVASEPYMRSCLGHGSSCLSSWTWSHLTCKWEVLLPSELKLPTCINYCIWYYHRLVSDLQKYKTRNCMCTSQQTYWNICQIHWFSYMCQVHWTCELLCTGLEKRSAPELELDRRLWEVIKKWWEKTTSSPRGQ